MKVLVLAGGLSPERNVSLSSGALIAQALRDLGHRAGSGGPVFRPGRHGFGRGRRSTTGPVPEKLRPYQPPGPRPCPGAGPSGKAADAPPSVPACWSCASGRTWSFWPSTAPAARTGVSRPSWTCWACPTPARGIWARPWPWIRTSPSVWWPELVTTPRWETVTVTRGEHPRPAGKDPAARGGQAHRQRLLHRGVHRP